MSKKHSEIESYLGMTVLWQRTFSIMMFDQTHYMHVKTRLYCDLKKKDRIELFEVYLHGCQNIIQVEN